MVTILSYLCVVLAKMSKIRYSLPKYLLYKWLLVVIYFAHFKDKDKDKDVTSWIFVKLFLVLAPIIPILGFW
jgi:hypothetical protein